MRVWNALCKGASSERWLARQARDQFTRQARVDNYKSRAAYKLKEINAKYHIFKPGQTVVDLGFAPGAWSQVALECTRPGGRVIGVDMLLVDPPPGVSAIQGNFLSAGVQAEVRRMLSRAPSERAQFPLQPQSGTQTVSEGGVKSNVRRREAKADIVLSDMCVIWPQVGGFWLNSINTPYNRLQSTSGLVVKDHAESMALCDAALMFSLESLRKGGSFVCKFYTGSDDRILEERLKRVFKRVFRVKPSATRKESREAYFVGLKKTDVPAVEVFPELNEST